MTHIFALSKVYGVCGICGKAADHSVHYPAKKIPIKTGKEEDKQLELPFGEPNDRH